MKKCNSCLRAVDNDANFCPNCGASIRSKFGNLDVSISLKSVENKNIITCGYCDGDGTMSSFLGRKECSVCKGKGKVRLGGIGSIEICGRCKGDGYSGGICPTCKGKGKIRV